jgi:hypothetical protein
MEKNAVSMLVAFIFTCLVFIIIVSSREIARLNDIKKTDAVLIDSLKNELDIEIFEKGRYISIVEQVSESDCPDVKKIIHGK